MIKENFTGTGKVVLIAGGGKIFTDIAARFVKSERPLQEIVNSPYSQKIVENILSCGHKAALEFDYFVFGVEGYSRVTEVQLVRKRLASYLIKSGRTDLAGKRVFSVVYPEKLAKHEVIVALNRSQVLQQGENQEDLKPEENTNFKLRLNARTLLELTEQWYDSGLENGVAEEDLRYFKPQATEFKGIIGMNAHALHDWFTIRCCQNAQYEIRDLANKMLAICKEVAPDLFKNAGPNCLQLGYCPENNAQNKKCKGKILTKKDAMAILRKHQRGESE
jgi:thymidylate synthase (FAD)